MWYKQDILVIIIENDNINWGKFEFSDYINKRKVVFNHRPNIRKLCMDFWKLWKYNGDEILVSIRNSYYHKVTAGRYALRSWSTFYFWWILPTFKIMSLLLFNSFFILLHYTILKFNVSIYPIVHEKLQKSLRGTVSFTIPTKLHLTMCTRAHIRNERQLSRKRKALWNPQFLFCKSYEEIYCIMRICRAKRSIYLEKL